MRTALIYRFHKDVEVHARRVEILRHFNPGVPIHGLYGGSDYPQACHDLGNLFDSIYDHPSRDGFFKWMHAEYMLRDWFVAEGHKHAFDRLVDHEWDILHVAPVRDVYARVPAQAAAFGGLTPPLEAMLGGWWWLAQPAHKQAFANYCRYAAMTYGIGLQRYICQGVGSVLPRTFLEKLATEPLPIEALLGVHCEITLPGYAEFLGFEIVNHGLHPPWTGMFKSLYSGPMFHCNSDEPITLGLLHDDCRRSRGPRRTSYHPVPFAVTLEQVLALPRPDQA